MKVSYVLLNIKEYERALQRFFLLSGAKKYQGSSYAATAAGFVLPDV